MDLTANAIEKLAQARYDLRLGLPIVLQKGEVFLCFAAVETLPATRLNNLEKHGVLTVALSPRRAETLKIQVYDEDIARIVVPSNPDLAWLRAIADPSQDLEKPFKGPFVSLRDTGAGPWRIALGLLKSARLLPAAVGLALSQPPGGLTLVEGSRIEPRLLGPPELQEVVAARVPIEAHANARLHVYRTTIGDDEHCALVVGDIEQTRPPLVRLHSACFTGDVLHSLKCDCGQQLKTALEQIGREEAGVLLYLNQEGRGIGLINKMRAYHLQDQGFDTVDANHRLGFEDEERDFRLGAAILKLMGITRVRLMTNNPAKIASMTAQGLDVVERVPLSMAPTPETEGYLATKKAKSGHML